MNPRRAADDTLEDRLFRQARPRFEAAGIVVRGVSTRPAQARADVARAEELPFLLLSDARLRITAPCGSRPSGRARTSVSSASS
ncbi:hypothetical protein C5F59_020175 [Streptomyces sp. QL37]|uniref:hypothetical protein n=1 Tax=Streptomyces sp. QL37 TaxID=2093747 RepID=UPI000CF1FC97|nr:hypothetical protein [Streptomyces sp. QL37]PPQ58415.1 hypothetical protein C5F59_18345 [Streptomyces sp. QL37]